MKNVFELFYGTLLIYMHTRDARFLCLESTVSLRWWAVQQTVLNTFFLWQFYPPHVCPVWLQSSMSLVLPPVNDSPSFPSAKLEEWRAINRSHFSPVNSPLVNGVDKPHLDPEAQYSQVKKPHVKRKTNQIKSGRSRGKSDYVN